MRMSYRPLIILLLLVAAVAALHRPAFAEPVFDSSYPADTTAEAGTLPPGRIKMTGQYRMAAGINSQGEGIFNESNGDFQERNFRYLFGEDLNNTFDPAIYDKFLLNLDFNPADKVTLHTQIVADPWSYVGQTGEQVQASDVNSAIIMRYNLKYFGSYNATLNEIYRNNIADSYAFPLIKVHDGHTTQTRVEGFDDFDGVSGDGHGIPFTIPELDLDYEFRPFREVWADFEQENWHVRFFPLASQDQALSTDDPLELSNHRDYWQQSPWLYQYVPAQFYTDGSLKRGYYSDSLSYLARDSEGHRLVLLRGASFEGMTDKTYLAATFAAPLTPWDDYSAADNIPGAVRLKHQATDRLMVGGVYTFRSGLVDRNIADLSQVVGADAEYRLNEHSTFRAQMAGSYRDRDMLTNAEVQTHTDGTAYKAELNSEFDHRLDGHTEFHLSFTQMDKTFQPVLSRYTNTRDDHFWGNHLTFYDYTPDLEHFRVGDGVDIGRMTGRFRWKEKVFKGRFENLFDVRNVHRTQNLAYKETVLRDEMKFKITRQLTAKGLFRWQGLPRSTQDVEPFIANFYIPDAIDPVFQNVDVPAGEDPSRFTYAAALQYVLNPQWTFEGFGEVTNNLPDFPRGLLNSSFRDRNDQVDGFLIDHVTNLLYQQGPLGGIPPYDYFTIFRERVVFKPDERVTVTFHAAQNTYKYAAGIDDNVNHQGVSLAFSLSDRMSFFMDYSHSMQIDVPRLINTNAGDIEYKDHHNVYVSMDYRLNSSTVFRAEYGVFGLGVDSPQVSPYSTTGFSLPTIDTEHLFRVSLTGDF